MNVFLGIFNFNSKTTQSVVNLAKLSHLKKVYSNSKADFFYTEESSNLSEHPEVGSSRLLLDSFLKPTASDSSDHSYLLNQLNNNQESCLDKLRGPFSLAYILPSNDLLLASDHLGLNSIYYYLIGQTLIFSNSLSQLLEVLEDKPVENTQFIENYLWSNFHRGVNETFYKNVFRLEASNYLLFSSNGLEKKKYYNFGDKYKPAEKSLEDYSERYLELFTSAVQHGLSKSKKPFLQLSGGLDSSSIAAVANNILLEDKLQALCNHTPNYPLEDESYFQKLVLTQCPNIKPHFFNMEPYWPLKSFGSDNNYSYCLPEVHPQRTYQHANLDFAATNSADLLITGAGADQINGGFAGYYMPRLLWDIPLSLWPSELPHFRKRCSYKKIFTEFILRQLLFKVNRKFFSAKFWKLNTKKKYPWLNDLEESEFLPITDTHNPNLSIGSNMSLTFLLSGWTALWRAGYEADSQHFGVRYFSPYNDIDLIEFMLSVPQYYKVRAGTAKYLARHSMKELLPEEVRMRPGSSGVYESVDTGLKLKERAKIEALFDNSILAKRGFINLDLFRREWSNYIEEDKETYQPFLYTIFAEAWAKEHYSSTEVSKVNAKRAV